MAQHQAMQKNSFSLVFPSFSVLSAYCSTSKNGLSLGLIILWLRVRIPQGPPMESGAQEKSWAPFHCLAKAGRRTEHLRDDGIRTTCRFPPVDRHEKRSRRIHRAIAGIRRPGTRSWRARMAPPIEPLSAIFTIPTKVHSPIKSRICTNPYFSYTCHHHHKVGTAFA